MLNCIENHPVRSLLTTFLLAVGTVWVVVKFTFCDSIELNHNAELQALEAQKQQCEQRIDVLEQEKKSLKRINDLYWECISTTPELTVYLKSQVERIMSDQKYIAESEIKEFIASRDSSSVSSEQSDPQCTYIEQIQTIKEQIYNHDAYVNADLELVIGVSEISVSNRADVNITVSGKPVATDKDVTVGSVYDVDIMGHRCQIVIKKINYIYGYVDVVISRNGER